MTESQTEAQIKIQEAMRLIEQAQQTLDKAAQQLCPVRGLGSEWTKCVRLYEEIRKLWYRVEKKLDGGKYDMQSFGGR